MTKKNHHQAENKRACTVYVNTHITIKSGEDTPIKLEALGDPVPGLDLYVAYCLAQAGFLVTIKTSSKFFGRTPLEKNQVADFSTCM